MRRFQITYACNCLERHSLALHLLTKSQVCTGDGHVAATPDCY